MAQKHNEEQINAPMTRLGTMALSGQQRIIRSSAFAAAKFTADNPVLQLGEMGYETDTGLLKVGDGVTAWNDLAYIGGGAGGLPSQTGHSGEFLTTDGTDASWAAVDALPDQTGQSGKFLTTDGTDASWSDKPLVNNATALNTIGIGSGTVNTNGVSVGYNTYCFNGGVAIGYSARITGTGNTESVAIGKGSQVQAKKAIQIGGGTNTDANTFKVANENGNFEMMSADGTIPAARHASLPASDGTYVLKLVISSGVPTLSWVAE